MPSAHIRISYCPNDDGIPPYQHAYELNSESTEWNRNAYLESALEISTTKRQFQGIPVIPYAPIYVPHLLGGSGKASQTRLSVDTPYGVRYIYQQDSCIGIWYQRPIVGWGAGTPEDYLRELGLEWSRHGFCSEIVVPVHPESMVCLNRLLEVTRVTECSECGGKGGKVVQLNVLLDLDMGGGDVAFTSYLPVRACSGAKLSAVFDAVAGRKLKGEFRLTQLPRMSSGIEQTYSYRVACAEDKGIDELIWYPDDDGEMWVLPFPAGAERFSGEGTVENWG